MPKSTEEIDIEEFEKSKKKPLVKYSDMPTEMGNEAVEVCTMALDKFNANRDYEGASVLIKNTLDKKFGASWQCAVGEGKQKLIVQNGHRPPFDLDIKPNCGCGFALSTKY